LSVVTVGEIEKGITQQRRHDPSFARELAVWLDRVLAWYGDRILLVDTATARRWGQLSAICGYDSADLLIAATALEHGLTVVTSNVRHFEPTGVSTLNPFK
jgi:predicted nucleic acid-binding protein